MTTNYYTSSSVVTPAYSDGICNTPLPPITTVTEKLYFSGSNGNKHKMEGHQSIISAMDGSALSAMDFNSNGENLSQKICQTDLSAGKGYGESNLSELNTNSFLMYHSTAEKFNFQNINSEFEAGGADFYINNYGEHQSQHHHLLPQMELIPSSVPHDLQPCVQQSWSSGIQQQLLQDEQQNEVDSDELQHEILLQQQALQLNHLLSQQLEQQNQQMQPQMQNNDLQQFQLLDNSHHHHQQQQQLQQHFQQQSQQLPQQQTQHLQQLYQDQGLMYDSNLPSNEGVILPSVNGDNADVLSNETYCADALANFLLKTEFSTSSCISNSVSSTTQPNFPSVHQSCRTARQCCSTLDLLETIRMESKKFDPNKMLVETDHVSPSHDLPSSTTDGCSKTSGAGKIGEGNGCSKAQVTEKEELNTKDIASRVNAELKKYSIPQAIFAERVLGRSQGTLSDLLRNPKPWSKLKSGRETFRRMRRWLDEPEHSRMVQLRVLSGDSMDGSIIRPANPAEGNSLGWETYINK